MTGFFLIRGTKFSNGSKCFQYHLYSYNVQLFANIPPIFQFSKKYVYRSQLRQLQSLQVMVGQLYRIFA